MYASSFLFHNSAIDAIHAMSNTAGMLAQHSLTFAISAIALCFVHHVLRQAMLGESNGCYHLATANTPQPSSDKGYNARYSIDANTQPKYSQESNKVDTTAHIDRSQKVISANPKVFPSMESEALPEDPKTPLNPLEAGQKVSASAILWDLKPLKPETSPAQRPSKASLKRLTKPQIMARLDAANIRYKKSENKASLLIKLTAA